MPEDNFQFDPSNLLKIITENKELGLALVQIPVTILEYWLSGSTELKWISLPSTVGYYWQKDPSGMITIIDINIDLLQLIHEQKIFSYKYAGPLFPPK